MEKSKGTFDYHGALLGYSLAFALIFIWFYVAEFQYLVYAEKTGWNLIFTIAIGVFLPLYYAYFVFLGMPTIKSAVDLFRQRARFIFIMLLAFIYWLAVLYHYEGFSLSTVALSLILPVIPVAIAIPLFKHIWKWDSERMIDRGMLCLEKMRLTLNKDDADDEDKSWLSEELKEILTVVVLFSVAYLLYHPVEYLLCLGSDCSGMWEEIAILEGLYFGLAAFIITWRYFVYVADQLKKVEDESGKRIKLRLISNKVKR